MAASAVTAFSITEGLEDGTVKAAPIDLQKDEVEAVQDGRVIALIA